MLDDSDFPEVKILLFILIYHKCAKKSEFINLFLDWLWMENVKEWIWWFMLLWAPFRALILGCKKEQTRRKRHLWQHAFKIYNIDNDFTFSLDMHFDWKIVDCFQRREKHVLIDLIFIFVDASISVATNIWLKNDWDVFLSSKDVRFDDYQNAFLC